MMRLGMGESDGPAEEGAVATEYVFLLVFVALAITAGVITYGTQLGGLFEEVGDRVQALVDQ